MNVKFPPIDKMMKKLNDAFESIEGRTLNGMRKVGLLILRDMENTPPLIPREYGNLINSRYLVSSTGKISMGGAKTAYGSTSEYYRTSTFKGPKAAKLASIHRQMITARAAAAAVQGARIGGPLVEFGFTMPYAVYVHERYEAKKWRRPNSGPGFLSAAIGRNITTGLDLMAKEARVK